MMCLRFLKISSVMSTPRHDLINKLYTSSYSTEHSILIDEFSFISLCVNQEFIIYSNRITCVNLICLQKVYVSKETVLKSDAY